MIKYLVAFLASTLLVFAQDIDEPYKALRQKLSLTEAQMKRLESPRVVSPPSGTEAASRASRSERSYVSRGQDDELVGSRGVLTSAQDAELGPIARVLERGQAAREAIQLGLISSIDWPGGGQCFDPDPQYEALGLGLTADQIAQLDRIGEANRSEIGASDVRMSSAQRRLHALLGAAKADASAIHQARADLVTERSSARKTFLEPSRAILNELQMARLGAFESDLEVASEAVALNILRAPGGEVFCH